MAARVKPASRRRPRRDTTLTIIGRIRGMIARREIVPGTQLPSERALAARFGVARGSLRTALRTLQGMGVLEARHGSGTYVSEGPPHVAAGALGLLAGLHDFSVDQMYEARSILEVAVAGLAAQHATREQIRALETELSGMVASMSSPQTYWRHDMQFHRLIGEACGNPILAALTRMVTDLLYEREREAVNASPDIPEATVMHQRLYLALAQRAPAAARRAMSEHLARAAAAASGRQR